MDRRRPCCNEPCRRWRSRDSGPSDPGFSGPAGRVGPAHAGGRRGARFRTCASAPDQRHGPRGDAYHRHRSGLPAGRADAAPAIRRCSCYSRRRIRATAAHSAKGWANACRWRGYPGGRICGCLALAGCSHAIGPEPADLADNVSVELRAVQGIRAADRRPRLCRRRGHDPHWPPDCPPRWRRGARPRPDMPPREQSPLAVR